MTFFQALFPAFSVAYGAIEWTFETVNLEIADFGVVKRADNVAPLRLPTPLSSAGYLNDDSGSPSPALPATTSTTADVMPTY